MPPKKQVEEKKILLGRPGNNLKTGIVGLANVGKSSLFNALTKAYLSAAENFPFCTINPEESKVIVPSPRFNNLCELYKPKSEVPAFLTITDIAGLVRGAASGEGLGNEFLFQVAATRNKCLYPMETTKHCFELCSLWFRPIQRKNFSFPISFSGIILFPL